MQHLRIIKTALIFLSLTYGGVILADWPPPPVNPPPDDTHNLAQTNTNASAFAVQAGAIAGVAQACGQDITAFTARVNEALDRLSVSSTDKVLAMARLQKALSDAQTAQATNHPFSCAQTLQDFNSLPILRSDYRQTVINQLSPTMGGVAPPTTAPQGNPTGNVSTGPSPGVGNFPNINTVIPPGTPPPPDFPDSATDNYAPNIIHQAPSVAPAVDATRPAPNINQLAPNPYQDQNPPANITNPYSGSYPTDRTAPPATNP